MLEIAQEMEGLVAVQQCFTLVPGLGLTPVCIQVCVSVFVGVFVLWEGVQEMHGCYSKYIQMCMFVEHL